MLVPIRALILAVAMAAATLTTACGGGGGGGGPGTAGTVALAGRVTLRDGSTANLGGIGLGLPGVGRSTSTGADGRFDFGSVPAGNLSIALTGSPATLRTLGNDEDDGEDDSDDREDDGDDGDDDDGDDRDGDDDDVGDDDSDLRGLRSGSRVEVRVEVRDGRIDRISVSCDDDDDRAEVRARLTRAPDADDPDVAGSIEVESRTTEEKFEIEAKNLAPGRAVVAVLRCEGVEASLGRRVVGSGGRAEWERDTGDGDALPHGALTVAELVGCDVEVRDADTGAVLLFGKVPELPPVLARGDDDDDDGDDDDGDDDDDDRERGRNRLARVSGASGTGYVELRRELDDGALRQRFEVEVEKFPTGLEVEVWVEDPASPGTMRFVARLVVGSFGEAELELDTKKGASLPFGVSDVQQLVGRTVEVRRADDGTVLLRGVGPALLDD